MSLQPVRASQQVVPVKVRIAMWYVSALRAATAPIVVAIQQHVPARVRTAAVVAIAALTVSQIRRLQLKLTPNANAKELVAVVSFGQT